MSQQTNEPRAGLVGYVVLTFAVSWLFWLPALLVSNNLVDLPVWLTFLRHLATFGPAIAAFWLVYRAGGTDGMKRLWKRGWDFSFDKRWLVPLFGLPLLTIGGTIVGINLAGGSIDWQHGVSPAMIVPVFLIIYLTNALPEEYSWRGYALGRLQVRTSPLAASLILGVIHALWHLPLHFLEGTVQQQMPILDFALKVVVGTIIYTWLYNHTGGSVFVATLYHAFANLLGAAVPYWLTSQGRWINMGIELVVVAVIAGLYGARTLTRSTPQRVVLTRPRPS